jgi:hypothetical protein
MKKPSLPRIGVLSLALVWTVSGCGGEKLYPVEGKVRLKDGTPLTGGLVTFEMIGDGPAKVCARGDIEQDGTFRLRTYTQDDGAMPGRYRVCVATLPGGGEGGFARPMVDPRFNSYETSGLEFSVERRKNWIEIEVERAN